MGLERLNRLAAPLLAGCLLAACGDNRPRRRAAPDTVATRVAEELAVSATLTALAPQPQVTPPRSRRRRTSANPRPRPPVYG